MKWVEGKNAMSRRPGDPRKPLVSNNQLRVEFLGLAWFFMITMFIGITFMLLIYPLLVR